MSPKDEETVERYVRFPQTLTEGERARVAGLLRADPVARRIAAFYRTFYDELDALESPAERSLGDGHPRARNEGAAPDEPG